MSELTSRLSLHTEHQACRAAAKHMPLHHKQSSLVSNGSAAPGGLTMPSNSRRQESTRSDADPCAHSMAGELMLVTHPREPSAFNLGYRSLSCTSLCFMYFACRHGFEVRKYSGLRTTSSSKNRNDSEWLPAVFLRALP